MSHFAKVIDGFVSTVIVAEQDVIDSGLFGDGWVQTSYNTYGGKHLLGGIPLRKNFASAGYAYDKDLDAFIPPKPFASHIFDKETCTWLPPIPRPNDGKLYYWDELTISWKEY